MSALILRPGESWWSPPDVSFQPLTSRLATPSRASGWMNAEPAAPLAFIPLRIQAAPRPREGSCVVAVTVFIFFRSLPLTGISPRQRPLYLLLTSFLFFLFVEYISRSPPRRRGRILNSQRKEVHVYTGGPAESLKGWRQWCGSWYEDVFLWQALKGGKWDNVLI